MRKINHMIVAFCVFAAVGFAQHAAAEGGRINFSGAVTTAGCHAEHIAASNEQIRLQLRACHESLNALHTFSELVQSGNAVPEVKTPAAVQRKVQIRSGQAEQKIALSLPAKQASRETFVVTTLQYQ